MYLYTNNVFIEAQENMKLLFIKVNINNKTLQNIIKTKKDLDKEQTIDSRKISSKILKETKMGDLNGSELRVVSH